MPQDREGTFSTRLFSRYQRNEKALVLALMEMYVEGVSTRKVKDITEELCGTSFSKSLVSSLAGRLDSELEAWRNRRLEARAYPYLFVDARYEKGEDGWAVVSQGVLVVSGVRDDGFREILAVEVADTESEATYQELFRSLKRRGAFGCGVGGLRRPRGPQGGRSSPLPGAAHQRCQVHYAGTSSGWWATPGARSSPKDLRGVFAAPSRGWLRARFELAQPGGARRPPQRSQSISKSTSRSALSCLAFPESHRRRIRTTNGLERLNQEIKSRTRVVRIFPNREACLRLVTALAVEQSEEWVTGRRYLDMEELEEHRGKRNAEAERR